MTLTPQLARIAARVYAVCAILTGVGVIGAVAFLIAVFGFHSADWQLLLYGGGPGLVFIVLGLFIWRQRLWAMLAALALIVAFRYFLGDSGAFLNIALIAVPILFALLTAVGLMAREPA